MHPTEIIPTRLGPVEVAVAGGGSDVILMFPGGHLSARSPTCEDVYVDQGFSVLTFSRPGYGRTDVGSRTTREFVPAIIDVCRHYGIGRLAAAVGVSFGGLQAAELAAHDPGLTSRLILHSSVSSLPYPDSRIERVIAPVAFSPRIQELTWWAVRRLVSTDRGLQVMMASLSTRPVRDWWGNWTREDRNAARSMFLGMASGQGFVTDLRQATAALAGVRERVLRAVGCSTLVTASHQDGGVAFRHAEDLIRTVPDSQLAVIGASSHLTWLGPSRRELGEAVQGFLAA